MIPELHPYSVEIVGCAAMLNEIRWIELTSGEHRSLFEKNGKYFVSSLTEEEQDIIMMALKDPKFGDTSWMDIDEPSFGTVALDYAKGWAEGMFVDGLWGDIEGVWDLAKAAAKLASANASYQIGLGVRLFSGDFTFKSEKAALQKASQFTGELLTIGMKVLTEFDQIYMAFATQDAQALAQYSERAQVVGAVAVELWDGIKDAFHNLTARQCGRIVGVAFYQIATILLTGGAKAAVAVGAKAGAAVSKGAVISKVAKSLERLFGSRAPLLAEKCEAVVKLCTEAMNTKMCFVAGTPIWTADGAGSPGSYQAMRKTVDEVAKGMRMTRGKYAPAGEIWNKGGGFNTGAENFWDHWVRHSVEYPGTETPLSYNTLTKPWTMPSITQSPKVQYW